MTSSTSSSDAARRFLAILALGIVAVELAALLVLPVERGRHEVDRRTAQIDTVERIPDSVLLSDSVSYGALDGLEVPASVLDLSSNQAIGVAGNAFFVRRLFERLEARDPGSARGVRVVYALSPVSFESNLDSARFLEPYFTSVFVRPSEIEAIEEHLDRPEIAELQRRDAARRVTYPPTYLRRGVVQTPIALALRALDRERRANLPVPSEPTPAAREEIATRGAYVSFDPSEVSRAFLPVLADVCGEYGATLRIVHAPVPPSIHAAWERTGYAEDYASWLEGIASDRPHVELVAAPPASIGVDAAFYDGVHLLPGPRLAWGRALLEHLDHDARP